MATIVPAQQIAIANLYVALFNRAPDATGFGYWVQALSNGASLSTITAAFLSSPESKAIYPSSQTSEQFITSFYATVFGRAPDATGLAFWAGVVNANGGSSSDAAKAVAIAQLINVVSTPLSTKPADITDAQFAQTVADRSTFTNKVIVGTYYAVDAKGTSVDTAKQVLSGVNNTDASVVAAKAIADTATNVGTTFTGTLGADSFTGTGANDTFNFLVDATTPANSTLSAVDKVAGGAGIDTLNVTTVGNADVLNAADVSGIETIAIRATGGIVTLTAAPIGVNTVSVSGAGFANVGTVTGLAAGTKFAIVGASGIATYAVTYAAAATAATVTLSGGQETAGSLTVNGAGLTSATISGFNGANVLTGVILASGIKSVTVDAQSALTTGAISNVGVGTTMTVIGAGVANVATINANVTTVTATANTGGLTAILGAATQKITGSAGVDTITTGIIVLTTGSVDAGAGTADTLIVNSNTALATAALGAKYTNFEIIQAAEGVTVDMDNIAGITGLRVTDLTGTAGFVNMSAAQAAAVTIVSADAAGAITLGVKNASTGGQIDTVKAALFTTVSGAAAAVDLTGLTLAGVEKLELTGNGTATGTTGLVTLTTTNATSLDSIIVKNVGGASITIDAAHSATNLSIDASGSAGAVTINASAYATTTGVIIKGGSGTNALTGSGNGDTIVGGAGNDTINGGVFTGVGSVSGVTESAVVTWNAFTTANPGSQTIGGLTVTTTGASTFTAAQVAQIANGSAPITGLTVTSPAVGWTVTADVAGKSLFTSTTANTDVANVDVAAGSTGIGSIPSSVTTPGRAAVAGTAIAAADTLTGGAGADTFVFGTPDVSTTIGAVTATITDFVSLTDKIRVTDGGAGSASNLVKATAVATSLATLLTAADNALNGTIHYYIGQFGADSYVVTDLDGTGYTNVIKLAGVALAGVVEADFMATPP